MALLLYHAASLGCRAKVQHSAGLGAYPVMPACLAGGMLHHHRPMAFHQMPPMPSQTAM